MATRTENGHDADIAGFDAFVEAVHAALNHLNDPAFQPTPALSRSLGLHVGALGWAEALRRSIQRLQPPAVAPPDTRGHRLYQILQLRYAQELTQEAAAEQLHITARHLRREQSDAVLALARLLWEKAGAATPAADEWSAQLRQELTALQRGAPAASTDVAETVRRVVELLIPVLAQSGTQLAVEELPPGLAVTVQATGLRQLLVRAITEWARHLSGGAIAIHARRSGEQVALRLRGSPAAIEHLPADPLFQEMLAQFGGGLAVEQTGDTTLLTLRLDAASPIRVLVVDDNEDLHHFYRRFVANTPYQIISLTDGAALLGALDAYRPDVVVLDVMLPDTDGWELLTQLRRHPLGRQLPVLVCSVIQEEELARALGASAYLRKPVGRRELLAALDAALL